MQKRTKPLNNHLLNCVIGYYYDANNQVLGVFLRVLWNYQLHHTIICSNYNPTYYIYTLWFRYDIFWSQVVDNYRLLWRGAIVCEFYHFILRLWLKNGMSRLTRWWWDKKFGKNYFKSFAGCVFSIGWLVITTTSTGCTLIFGQLSFIMIIWSISQRLNSQ